MVSPQQTLSHMRSLRLPTMVETYQSQLRRPEIQEMSFDERLGILFDSEITARANSRIKKLIKKAELPEFATLEEIDWRASRGLDKKLIDTLSTCEWVGNNLNLMVLGATGVGKTWLACAFGAEACRKGMSVLFGRCTELYTKIARSMLDGTLPKLKAKLSQTQVLVLDDIGLGELSVPVANVLLEIIDRRQRSGSLIITSQFPVEDWHRFIPDPTLADAILDRIVHKAHRIPLKGESLRKIYGKKQMEEGS